GLSREALAAGIREIVNETMASAARVHIAERGKDPRRYALLATGGGGPLHGADVARKLGLKRLISPASAGVASAIGLLIAPARVDRVATVARRLDQIDWPIFEDVFARLELDAQKVIDATGLDPKNTTVIRRADVRYVGQAFEVIVDLPPGPYNANSMSALILAFEAAYVSKFTRKPPAGPVEIINARVGVSVSGQPLSINLNDTIGNPTERTTRKVWSAKAAAFVNTDVYSRYSLRPGDEIDGPALVEERESTLVIPEGAHARVATGGEIVVDLVGENS
ncbi:MAG: hydantoinase/oxoprolinase family protein, partial [Rhodospirillales bacterium]